MFVSTPLLFFFLLLYSFVPTPACASLTEALDQAQRMDLAHHPYWLRLLHYPASRHRRTLAGSKAQGSLFFLASTGAKSPTAELVADLQGFYTPLPEGDNHPQCRLPARLNWLREQLGSRLHDLPIVPCNQYNKWRAALATQHISLIFASDYTNNPSSMFGHTFLRLDSVWPTPDPLLSYAISYAAATRETNGIIFAIKGLSGGYPGQYSLMPYYEKVNQYIAIEDRDLWEYSLNLSTTDIDRLLAHVWELQDVTFPYYFFTDNCANELLRLLETANPALHLSSGFNTYAIPADTIRYVVHHSPLVSSVYFRPAHATQVQYRIATNPPAVNKCAAVLLAGHPLANCVSVLSSADAAAALETASGLLGLVHDTPLVDQPRQHTLQLSLLQQRAALGQQIAPAPMPWPTTNPAQGHDSAGFYALTGLRQGHPILNAGGHPAYHTDAEDSRGYRPGASIDFLDLEAQYREQDRHLHLNSFTLLDIQSYAARSALQHPLSWQLHLGAEDMPIQHQQLDAVHTHVVESVSAGMGMAWSTPSQNQIVHGLLETINWLGPSVTGAATGVGLNLGLTQQIDNTHTQLSIEPLCMTQSLGCWWRTQASWNQTLLRNLSLRCEWQRWQKNSKSLNTLSMGVYHFY